MKQPAGHILLRSIHWLMAILLIAMISVGYTMQELSDRSEIKWQLYSLHKSFGVTLFSLLIIRLLLRFNQKTLPQPDFKARWHKSVFLVVHVMLYLMMLAMPVTGYLLTSPYGVLVFGIELPVVREQFYVAGISRYFHGWFALTLLMLIIVHIAAYLRHMKRRRN